MKDLQRGGSRRERRGAMIGAAAATASLLIVTACSGGATGLTTSNSTAGTAHFGVVTDGMKPVTHVDAPTKPFNPPTHKHILIMPCGSSGQGCVNEATEEKKVAESLGWTVDVADGKLDPTVWNQVVKQAADSGVDGIIAISADPNLYGEAMAEVRAKHIPFVLTQQPPSAKDVPGIGAYVATDPVSGGKPVAQWIEADSGGKAHVLLLGVPGFAAVQARAKTIGDTLKSNCPNCVVYQADVSPQTLATTLAPLVTSQLQQHPDINYVWGSDDAIASFVQQGIRVAGKAASVQLVSMTGYPQQMAQIKTGEIAAELATPTLYAAWLAVDCLGRLMAGAPLQKTFWPVPQRIFTKQNIDQVPPSVFKDGWNTDVDYKATFEKLWRTQ